MRIVKIFAITDTAVVPPIVTSLLRLPKEERHSLDSLRYILCAGAPIAASLQAELYDVLSPDAVVAQVWGTTEVGWATMFTWNEKDLSGSVGRPQPGVELRLISDGIAVDEEMIHGEAYIRSPSMFTHYLNDAAATAAALDTEGFYRTGDRAYIQDGKVFIDGRVKDTLKVKGWQVSPYEIEAVLLEHPRITDAAVIGIPTTDDDGLETTLPRAYVVLRTDASTPALDPDFQGLASLAQMPLSMPSEQEVIDFAASKLVTYKKLTGGVVFVDNIPRNATGKILRRLLHSDAERESPAFRSSASVTMSASTSDDLALDGGAS